MLRECGRYVVSTISATVILTCVWYRQGVLPFTKFWTSTRPFGTPLGPYFIKWALTIIMIIAPPAGDAFNFSMYPIPNLSHISNLCGSCRLEHLSLQCLQLSPGNRYSYHSTPAPATQLPSIRLQSLDCIRLLCHSLKSVYAGCAMVSAEHRSRWRRRQLLVCDVLRCRDCNVSHPMSSLSNSNANDNDLDSIAACGVYYYLWIKVLPRIGGYELRQTIINVGGDATAHKLVKVPKSQVEEWDQEHDASGRLRRRHHTTEVVTKTEETA